MNEGRWSSEIALAVVKVEKQVESKTGRESTVLNEQSGRRKKKSPVTEDEAGK